MKVLNNCGAKEISLEAYITRADGTIVPLGTIAYYHRNPLRVLLYRLKRTLHLI